MIQKDEEQLMQKIRLDHFSQISLPLTPFQFSFMVLFNLQNTLLFFFLFGSYYHKVGETPVALTSQVIQVPISPLPQAQRSGETKEVTLH